jgi:hypothetical protein
VGFEPTIPASERAKTFYALDRAATDLLLAYETHEIAIMKVCGDVNIEVQMTVIHIIVFGVHNLGKQP